MLDKHYKYSPKNSKLLYSPQVIQHMQILLLIILILNLNGFHTDFLEIVVYKFNQAFL
jgi:hypothetical protein